ncbi:penicillin-binding transpeptidase domain-containing protein [Streptomyces sp. CAU 1734]|uniref:penicillin-binding transpeptidase domain-containing protein n=1 Tax=Streptomyces sp. CAU 1734 TaxID=3140360 RepID=UPI0032609070
MRSGAKVAIVGGVFLVVAGGVAYGGHQFIGGSAGAPEKKTGPLSAAEVDQATEDFLTAWAADKGGRAARLTNNPVESEPLLAAFRTETRTTGTVITPGTPAGTTVPFTVKTTVKHPGGSTPWTYSSKLTVVRGKTTGRPLVEWKPAVVHPELTDTTTLGVDESHAPGMKLTDHRGRSLTGAKYPSLAPILGSLREKYAGLAGGTPGTAIVLESTQEGVASKTLLTLNEGTPGTLRTTLDADVQAAAEEAVRERGQASAVAIKPSTGEIRAVANSPAGGFNTAMSGAQAPGSTMKIVTAAMMLDQGLVQGPGSKVECPAEVSWLGAKFENLERFSLTGPTFKESFLRSCNTTFIKPVKPLGDKSGTVLGATAEKYFGIGLSWTTGVPSHDGKVPQSAGTETAASYIGQGKITMNALTVASLSATVKNGAFKQPFIVPRSIDKRPLASADALPPGIASALREMMNATAVSGSGQASMASVSGDKGAKTGSAEVDGQGKSNSWFTGYADDLAAAAVVQSGGRGGESAGPVVARVLNAR